MKKAWQEHQPAGWDQPEWVSVLQQRNQTALKKLRSNLLLEIVLAVLLTLFLGWKLVVDEPLQAKAALIAILSQMAMLGFFYVNAWRHLNRTRKADLPLKQNLQEMLHFWRLALRQYFWGGVLLFPLFFIAVRLWRDAVFNTGPWTFFTGSPTVIALKGLAFWFVMSLLLWYLIHLSYGKHLQQIRKSLEELEEKG